MAQKQWMHSQLTKHSINTVLEGTWTSAGNMVVQYTIRRSNVSGHSLWVSSLYIGKKSFASLNLRGFGILMMVMIKSPWFTYTCLSYKKNWIFIGGNTTLIPCGTTICLISQVAPQRTIIYFTPVVWIVESPSIDHGWNRLGGINYVSSTLSSIWTPMRWKNLMNWWRKVHLDHWSMMKMRGVSTCFYTTDCITNDNILHEISA